MMDSKVERIVPGSALRVGQARGRPGDGERKKRFRLDERSYSSEGEHPGDPQADAEGRTVSGPEDGEAGVRIDLTA
jgi:hypothetical protein